MAKAVVIGAGGQLAHDLVQEWRRRRPGDELVELTHADLEVTDAQAVGEVLARHRPQVVVNTSAYHRVDVVEETPERAFAVNAAGVRNLALACRELEARLVHFSTDYVFSGARRRPYRESDPVDPVNVYGVSKVAGEMLLRYLLPGHLIVRSCGLYGVAGSSGKGGNFVETMLRLAGAGNPIRVVDDQVLTPTSTRALSRQVVALLESEAAGTFHATCQGECSWFEFAAEIFRLAGLAPSLAPQSTRESGARALRPAYSVLENARLDEHGLDVLPAWQEALAEYMRERESARREAGQPVA